MMTHLAVPGVWYMRGPPESPAQGSCHSPLLNSTSVPNIFLCLYFVWETLRLTLLSSLLCCRVQRSCSLSVVNLWTGIILGTLSFHSISLLKSSLPIWISLNSAVSDNFYHILVLMTTFNAMASTCSTLNIDFARRGPQFLFLAFPQIEYYIIILWHGEGGGRLPSGESDFDFLWKV